MIEKIQNTSQQYKNYWLSNYCTYNELSFNDTQKQGVYILYGSYNSVLYVGRGKVHGRIMEHCKKRSKNHEWTYGFIIPVQKKIFQQILEKLFIAIFKPENNKSKPSIQHIILAEKLTSTSNSI